MCFAAPVLSRSDLRLETLVVGLDDLHIALDNLTRIEVGHLHRARLTTEEVTIRVTGEDDLKPHSQAARQTAELRADFVPIITRGGIDVASELDVSIVAVKQRDEPTPTVLLGSNRRDIANLKVSRQTANARNIVSNVKGRASSFLLETRGGTSAYRSFGRVVDGNAECADFASPKRLSPLCRHYFGHLLTAADNTPKPRHKAVDGFVLLVNGLFKDFKEVQTAHRAFHDVHDRIRLFFRARV